MSLNVAGYTFVDEKQLTRYIISIRQKYEFNKKIEIESGDGRFLSALLTRHPDWPYKFLSGVSAFKTGRYQARNQQGFMRIDRSGHCTNFPYQACAHGIGMCPNRLEIHTAWKAIEYNMCTFERDIKEKRCDTCKEPLEKALARHVPPRTLVGLWNDFKSSSRKDVLKDDFRFINRDTLLSWQHAHAHDALLERLCPRCYYQLSENKV